eukprot:3810784-Amphidinium_carterae.1
MGGGATWPLRDSLIPTMSKPDVWMDSTAILDFCSCAIRCAGVCVVAIISARNNCSMYVIARDLVLPDFRGQDTQHRTLGPTQRLWRSKLVRYARVLQKKGKPGGGERLKRKYLPNKWHARALDHTLKSGTGLCLQDFTHTPATTALLQGERRHSVPANKLPEPLRANLQGRLKR